MGNEEPVPFAKPTDFKFSSLPAELRTIIWVLAVPVQNRLVDSPTFRAIKHAPCPVLFLVCKEAKACAETQYQRLQRYKKGYNLLMGNLIPAIGAQGLPISLDHDIFLIQDRKWNCWYTGNSNPRVDAMASRTHGKKLTEACERIEKFSASGVRRVCVTCIGCRAHRGYSEVKQGDWLQELCHGCSGLCENIFYPGTRARLGRAQEEQEWVWKWTHRVQEVFHLHYSRDSAKQVFPSLGACECSLCRPWSRMDREYLQLLKDDVPKDPDYNTHDMLFRRSRELWQAGPRPVQ
jgi:hypothetical protein